MQEPMEHNVTDKVVEITDMAVVEIMGMAMGMAMDMAATETMAVAIAEMGLDQAQEADQDTDQVLGQEVATDAKVTKAQERTSVFVLMDHA